MIDQQPLSYGRAAVTPLPFDDAVEHAKSFLKEEGFGVLCEIDVTKTLHEKLGETFRPYRILGACNPQFAHRALSAEPQLGLLLPCNVVVQELEGATVVSAIDARTLLAVVGRPALEDVAIQVNERLQRVVERLANFPA